jgi:hypothetical protein
LRDALKTSNDLSKISMSSTSLHFTTYSQLRLVDRSSMGDIMMLASMATHHVPSLPPRDPSPTDIHLDDDPKIVVYDTSDTTISPPPESTDPDLVLTQTHIGRTETAETTSQVPTPAGAEGVPTSSKVQMGFITDKNLPAKSTPEIVQHVGSASSPQEEVPDNIYTASAPVNNVSDVTSGSTATLHGAAGEDIAVIAIYTDPCTEKVLSTESHTAEVTEPEVVELESSEPTKTKSTTDAAAPELEVTKTVPSEQTDLDVVEISSDENGNGCSENLNRSKLVTENTHIQGDPDHLKIASELASSDNDPPLATEPNPDDDQPNDMSAQVARLAATYNPSGESSISQMHVGSNTAKAKLLDDTTAQVARLAATYGSSGQSPISQLEAGRNAEKTKGHPDEQPSQENDEVVTMKLAVDNQEKVKTFESNSKQDIETIVVAEPRVSLFGGPAGPPIPPQSDILETSGVGSVVQTDPTEGFEDLFQEATDAPTALNNIWQENAGVDMSSFSFPDSNIEEDVEPEADAGAEQENFGQPPSSDYDAKPDMNVSFYPTSTNYSYGPTSPTYSHATSNSSNASKKSSASELQEVMDLMYYNRADDNKETPEELAKLEQGVDVTGHSISEPPKEPSPCTCEHHCRHRVCKEFNLREGPRKEDCVYFNNLVYDNDQSGTYTDEHKKFLSSLKVDVEDMDDDEESVEDKGRDSLMSGGLAADSMGRYTTTIPFNHTDTLIRNKRVFDEESSSSDESQAKSKKKRKKTKTKSFKASKRSKNNNGNAIQRTSESVEEDIEIDEQASTPAPKAPTKPTKKTPSTAEPNQTIVQMLQRLAKPHLTKLSYSIIFNSPVSSCSICNTPSYAIYGCSSTPRKIKIYDFGQGNTEIPDANQAGNAMTMAVKPKDTHLCLACTTGYMKILVCSNHDITPTSPPQPSSSSSTSTTSSDLQQTCSVCPAPSTYTCDHNCGAKFCDTCAIKLYGKFDGSLSGMLDTIKDEVSGKYKSGLRADVELLREGGELWKFLGRMARKRVAA